MIIQTKSLELAVYAQGDNNANRFALVLPGLFDTKDYAHMRSHVELLASLGYYTLSFDPPGTWESPGDISLYTSTNYQRAINELIEHFGNKPTFVMGHSRGATMSIAAGVTNPFVTAFAAVMPSHIRGDYLGTVDEKWKQDGYMHLSRDLPPGGGEKVKQADLPYSFFEDQITYDFTDALQACTKPKLFVYGTQDTGATPERVKTMYDIAGEPKQIQEIEGNHDYRLDSARIDQVNNIIKQFVETLA